MNGHTIKTLDERKLNGAVMSDDKMYRYILWRSLSLEALTLDHARSIAWIMLNPSTADEKKDDPTIRRIIDFSTRWGFHRLDVVNLFAYRSKDPINLLETKHDPVGEANDSHISVVVTVADWVIFAWGAHAIAQRRVKRVQDIVLKSEKIPLCLGKTSKGYPRHPLYVKKDVEPEDYLTETMHGV